MKILFVTDRFLAGGAETHMTVLAAALTARGHRVEIASAGGEGLPMLKGTGILHHTLPLASKNPAALLRARRGLRDLLDTEKYDVVHAHARLPASLIAPLCRHRSIPLTVTAHWVFRSDGWRQVLCTWGDHTLAVSEDICRYLEKDYRLPAAQITKTQNGIDTQRFSPAARGGYAVETATERRDDRDVGVEGQYFVPEEGGSRGLGLLHISRLDEGRSRAATLLIALAPRLAAAGISSLLIVGGGNQEKTLRNVAEEINRRIGRSFIRMSGAVSDVLPYFYGASLFVGASRAALEAMAVGLPTVLAGDEGFLPLVSPETATLAEKSNFCGRGLSPLTEEGLFSAIAVLVADPRTRAEAGAFGREYVKAHHTADAMAEDALFAYHAGETACKGHRRNRATRRNGEKPRLLLCGYYGYGNLGDEAVLARLQEELGESFSLTVLSGECKESARIHGAERVSRQTPFRVLRAIQEADVFLLGGGNLLQNETSNRSLSYYTLLFHLARRAGCRTVLLGGIGRLDRRGEERVCKILPLFDRAYLRTPRDLLRYRALCGRHTTGKFLPDGGLLVYGARPPYRERKRGERTVLLSLRAGDHEAAVLFSRIAHALTETGLLLHFIGLSMQGVRDLSAFAPFSDLPGFYVAMPQDFHTAATLIKEADLILSTRLHALIFASAAGVPAAAPAAEGKLSDFAELAADAEREARKVTTFPAYPMLSFLPPQKNPSMTALTAALCEGPSDEARAAYLTALIKNDGLDSLSAELTALLC